MAARVVLRGGPARPASGKDERDTELVILGAMAGGAAFLLGIWARHGNTTIIEGGSGPNGGLLLTAPYTPPEPIPGCGCQVCQAA